MGNQDMPKMMTMAINILFVLLVLASSSILFFADLEQEYNSFARQDLIKEKTKANWSNLKESFLYRKNEIDVLNKIITFI